MQTKYHLNGKEINLTSDNAIIKSTNFNVDKNGNMTCSNANVTGTVNATQGKIGNFTIKDGYLYVREGNLKTKITDKGFSIWGVTTVAGVEVDKEILNLMTDGINTWLHLKGFSTGVADIITDHLTTSGNVKCTKGSISFGNENTADKVHFDVFPKGDANIFGNLDVTGNVYADNISSDRRLKRNIKKSTANALDTIKKIKHRQFEKITDNKHYDIGYIAQELEEIEPNFVFKKEATEQKEERYYINELPIIATITKAIQEQQKQIEEQQEEIKSLKKELKKLKGEN